MATSSPISPYYGGSFGKVGGSGGGTTRLGGGGGSAGFSPVAALTTAGFAASAATIYRNTKDIDTLRKDIEIIQQGFQSIKTSVQKTMAEAIAAAKSSLLLSSSSSSQKKKEDIVDDDSQLQEQMSSCRKCSSITKEEVENITNCYLIESNKKMNRRLKEIDSKLLVFESSIDEIFKSIERLEDEDEKKRERE